MPAMDCSPQVRRQKAIQRLMVLLNEKILLSSTFGQILKDIQADDEEECKELSENMAQQLTS